jgi:hypothetical protein
MLYGNKQPMFGGQRFTPQRLFEFRPNGVGDFAEAVAQRVRETWNAQYLESETDYAHISPSLVMVRVFGEHGIRWGVYTRYCSAEMKTTPMNPQVVEASDWIYAYEIVLSLCRNHADDPLFLDFILEEQLLEGFEVNPQTVGANLRRTVLRQETAHEPAGGRIHGVEREEEGANKGTPRSVRRPSK